MYCILLWSIAYVHLNRVWYIRSCVLVRLRRGLRHHWQEVSQWPFAQSPAQTISASCFGPSRWLFVNSQQNNQSTHTEHHMDISKTVYGVCVILLNRQVRQSYLIMGSATGLKLGGGPKPLEPKFNINLYKIM